MDKEIIVKTGILIAAKELKIEPIDYAVDSDGILEVKNIAGLYHPIRKTIVINGNWLSEASNNEVLLVVFHEMRHYYQSIQIHLLGKKEKLDGEQDLVKIWKKEFQEYHSPFRFVSDTYLEQEIEKDAIEFSQILLNKVFRFIISSGNI